MPTRNDRHLTMDELVERIEAGLIDTVVVAFTDMQGRLQGKRLHGRYFADARRRPRHGGLQLPARRRRRHEHRRRLRHLLVGEGVRRHGVRPGRPDDPGAHASARDRDGPVRPDLAGPLARAPVAALDPAEAARPGGRARVDGAGRHRARVHPVRHDVRGGARQRLSRPGAVEPVQHRLLDPRHHAGGAVPARRPQPHVRRRHGGRGRQGRVQLRPAGDRLPVRRGDGDRGQPRRLQDGLQGDRLPARQVGHVPGEVQRARGQLLPHPPVAARHRR